MNHSSLFIPSYAAAAAGPPQALAPRANLRWLFPRHRFLMHRLAGPNSCSTSFCYGAENFHCRPGSSNDATDATSDVSKSSCLAGNYGQHRSADDSADFCSTYCHLGLIDKGLPGMTNLCGAAKEIAGEHSRVHRAGNSGSSGVRCRYLGQSWMGPSSTTS